MKVVENKMNIMLVNTIYSPFKVGGQKSLFNCWRKSWKKKGIM